MSDSPYKQDPKNPRYYPPPEQPAWFRRALRQLGGGTPAGEDMLTCSWGMDIGADGRTDHKQKPFGVWTPKWSEVQRKEPRTIYYVKYQGRSGWLSQEQLPRVMPSDAVVLPKKYHRWHHYGPPCWIVMQWKPAHMHDSPEGWEASRWVYTAKPEYPNSVYDSVTGRYKADSLGDYPSRGLYELVFRVTDEFGAYISLDDAGGAILEELARRLKEREGYKKTREQAIKDFYDGARRSEERQGKAIFDDAMAFFNEPSHRTRLVEGDAFSGFSVPQPTTPATVIKRANGESERIVLADR